MCLLSENVYDYTFIAQGKVTIPGLDDGEELSLTDVSGYRTPQICCTTQQQSNTEYVYVQPKQIFWGPAP